MFPFPLKLSRFSHVRFSVSWVPFCSTTYLLLQVSFSSLSRLSSILCLVKRLIPRKTSVLFSFNREEYYIKLTLMTLKKQLIPCKRLICIPDICYLSIHKSTINNMKTIIINPFHITLDLASCRWRAWSNKVNWHYMRFRWKCSVSVRKFHDCLSPNFH